MPSIASVTIRPVPFFAKRGRDGTIAQEIFFLSLRRFARHIGIRFSAGPLSPHAGPKRKQEKADNRIKRSNPLPVK